MDEELPHAPQTNQARQQRSANYNNSFAARRDADVQGSLSALSTIRKNLVNSVDDAVSRLVSDACGIGSVIRCDGCKAYGTLEVCGELVTVGLVSIKFARSVKLPRYVKCTSCESDKVLFNPVWVNYFPASPTKLVCCPDTAARVCVCCHYVL